MQYLYMLPGALLAPMLHGWVKAALSAGLGDPTPKKRGFLSWRPWMYFETVGFFMILLFGYGWGQPVPVSAFYYKDRRKGVLLTHIAPSVVSLLMGAVAAAGCGLLRFWLTARGGTGDAWLTLQLVLLSFAHLNAGMGFFGLVPVHPLNGARLLQLFLRPEQIAKMNQYEKIFQIILVILLIMRVFTVVLSPLTDSVVGLHNVVFSWMIGRYGS